MNARKRKSTTVLDRTDKASHVTLRASFAPVPPTVGSPRLRKERRAEKADKRIRDYRDGPDELELSLFRHGLNLDDVHVGAKQYDSGTRTPYAKLCHAVLRWWCDLPMTGRQVVWVDERSGYTWKNVPKFSTALGRSLMSKGLAGGRWAYSRSQLLDLRAWAAQMLALTPKERLAMAPQPGDAREHVQPPADDES